MDTHNSSSCSSLGVERKAPDEYGSGAGNENDSEIPECRTKTSARLHRSEDGMTNYAKPIPAWLSPDLDYNSYLVLRTLVAALASHLPGMLAVGSEIIVNWGLRSRETRSRLAVFVYFHREVQPPRHMKQKQLWSLTARLCRLHTNLCLTRACMGDNTRGLSGPLSSMKAKYGVGQRRVRQLSRTTGHAFCPNAVQECMGPNGCLNRQHRM